MQMVLKETNEAVDVYNITYDRSGFPHFLIYENGQWILKSAKHFRPPEAKDIAKMIEGFKSSPLFSQEEVELDAHYIG